MSIASLQNLTASDLLDKSSYLQYKKQCTSTTVKVLLVNDNNLGENRQAAMGDHNGAPLSQGQKPPPADFRQALREDAAVAGESLVS